MLLFTAHMLLLIAYMLAPLRMSGQGDVIKEVLANCQPSSDVSTHNCDRNDILIWAWLQMYNHLHFWKIQIQIQKLR